MIMIINNINDVYVIPIELELIDQFFRARCDNIYDSIADGDHVIAGFSHGNS